MPDHGSTGERPTPLLPPPWDDVGARGPRIRDVRVILTAPEGIRLVVVKIETDEPGLYGLGCATFTQRPLAVVTAVEQYLKPLVDRARRRTTSRTSGQARSSAPTGGAVRC